MKLRSALVISGGGFQGLGLIKALRAVAGMRILLADCHAENVARFFADVFVLAPLLKEEQAFLDLVLGVCARESVSAVFASTDYELELLSRNRAAFASRGATVYVSDMPLLRLASDKLAFYRWLQSENLPCLPCYSSPEDSGAIFPLIGKPRRGWGGRGVHLLPDRKDMAEIPHSGGDGYVWQPCLHEFEEYSVDFSVDTAGGLSPLGFRRRIRSLGGFAILCEPGAPSHVCDAARRTIERLIPLGACGPMNLQLLQAGDECWISDLNPRAGTSMSLSIIAGTNPIDFLLAGEGNDATRSAMYGPRARTFRYLEERIIPDTQLNDVRGVVFDLDDTLLDQKAWMVSKLELTWSEQRNILPEREPFLSLALQIIEEGNRAHLFDALCLQLGLDEAARTRLIETYRNARPQDRPLYSDVLVTLHRLRQLGYRIAILTDNPPASQRLKLEVCGLMPLTDALVLTAELGRQKPDPEVFTACARLLDLPSGQLVMVGDNLYRDIEGAHVAGYRHAFQVQRTGAFFNFSPDLAARLRPPSGASTLIAGLNELFWHLSGYKNHDITT